MTDKTLKGYVDPISKDDLLDEYAARIAALEAALKPFVDAEYFKVKCRTGTVITQTMWKIHVLEADLRAARAAYLGEKND